ncbi:hypothetical protein [Actinosynnema sp. NPDC020468]|uniref:hypothetical protein n=1 Tax=Actinosynnema sp. NPDC020468 TaxID=3154488 RepID=UPI0033E86014
MTFSQEHHHQPQPSHNSPTVRTAPVPNRGPIQQSWFQEVPADQAPDAQVPAQPSRPAPDQLSGKLFSALLAPQPTTGGPDLFAPHTPSDEPAMPQPTAPPQTSSLPVTTPVPVPPPISAPAVAHQLPAPLPEAPPTNGAATNGVPVNGVPLNGTPVDAAPFDTTPVPAPNGTHAPRPVNGVPVAPPADSYVQAPQQPVASSMFADHVPADPAPAPPLTSRLNGHPAPEPEDPSAARTAYLKPVTPVTPPPAPRPAAEPGWPTHTPEDAEAWPTTSPDEPPAPVVAAPAPAAPAPAATPTPTPEPVAAPKPAAKPAPKPPKSALRRIARRIVGPTILTKK